MNPLTVAEFRSATALLKAARQAKRDGHQLVDAFSPFPVQGMAELLGSTSTRLRVVMFVAGMGVAAAAYGIEGWSAVFNYPINSGGRPLNSWPAFMLFPFAIGIFGAAFAGMVGLLVQTSLPSLYHPLFFIDGFERATQTSFMLALRSPQEPGVKTELAILLRKSGAVNVWELEQ